jgi:polar amino acid transport system permease protein
MLAAQRIVPAAYWTQRLLALALTLGVITAGVIVSRSDQVQWSAIPQYFFEASILQGIRLTLILTFLAITAGLVGGTILAMLRGSGNPVLVGLAYLYIWFFRGTPLLVQLIFWFNIQLFVPEISFGSHSIQTNELISSFTAAMLALGLNEAAYMSEIVRGGILAVDRGQSEAATALGYTPYQTFRHIIMPQALRVIIPPIGNQTISMLKTTSLVSVVAAQDLLTRAQNIYAKNFLVIELLFVAASWYLIMTSIAIVVQIWIERRLSQDGPARASVGAPRRWFNQLLWRG